MGIIKAKSRVENRHSTFAQLLRALLQQTTDKGASRPVLLTRGTPKWSSFGFTKQFLEGVFSEVRHARQQVLHKNLFWEYVEVITCEGGALYLSLGEGKKAQGKHGCFEHPTHISGASVLAALGIGEH